MAAAVTTPPPTSPPLPDESLSGSLSIDTSAKLRDGPISPVRVNFQDNKWHEPSNADIEHATHPIPHKQLASMSLDTKPLDDAAISRVRAQDINRNSRESDESNTTSQAPASLQSSAPTSASSISASNENTECAPVDHSAGSSVIEDPIPRNQSVPLFQYHHNHQQDSGPDPRAARPQIFTRMAITFAATLPPLCRP